MTQTNWLNKMKMQQRHILLLLDNCPGHPTLNNLSNVTVKFLPKRTTSELQPLDQGIIAVVKKRFSTEIMDEVNQMICASCEDDQEDTSAAMQDISHEEALLSLKCIRKLCIGNKKPFEMVNSTHQQLQSQKTAVELNSKTKQSSIMPFMDKRGTV